MLRIYKDNPTADAQNGTAVSMLGDYSSPVHFALDARTDDEQILTLALRCDDGYRTHGTTTVTDYNDTKDRYQFSADGTNWSDKLEIADVIENSNVLFYAKARIINADYSQLDRTAKICLDYVLDWA